SGWQHADPPPTPDKPPPETASRADRLPDGAVARLGWSPHRVGNSAFALTPDEKEIVTVSPEGIVRRFDAKTGRLIELRQLTDRADVRPVGDWSADLSADGRTAAVGESLALGYRVTVWDVPAGKLLFRWAQEKQVRGGVFTLSPDGRVLAISEYVRQGAILRAFDVSTGKGRELGPLEMNVYNLKFSADSQRLVVSEVSGRPDDRPGRYLSCFDVPAGKKVWKLPANCDKFAVSSDGRTAIFAQYDRPGYRLIETDLKTNETTQTEQPHAPAHPNVPVAFAPDDRTLLAAEFNDLIAWDIRAGKVVSRIKLPQAELVGFGPELGAFSADGRTVITKRGALARWDLTTGKPVFEAVAGDGLGAFVEHLAFTPDGKALYAAGYVHNAAVWDLATGKRTTYHRDGVGKHLVTTPEGLRSVGVDGRTPCELVIYGAVACTPTKSVRWTEEKEAGANRLGANAPAGDLGAYTLSADGRTLLWVHSDSPRRDGTPKSYVTAHDIVTDRQVSRFTLSGVSYSGRSPFSPCGRWLALEGKVYHVRTGTELFAPADGDSDRLVAGTPFSLRGAGWFSPDGRLLAGRLEKTDGSVGDKLVVWELASGRVVARLPNAGLVTQVVFSPDGRTIALADGRGARVYDVLTERRLAEFIAPDITGGTFENDPQTIAFSPDGRRLATGHCEGSVLIWAVPRPEAAEVRDLWAAIGDTSPVAGRAGVERAVRDPAALKTLMERFRPPPEEPDPPVAARIADLDSDSYATREAASKKLRELGAKAEPALRRALAAARSAEARRRLEDILAAVAPAVETLPVPAETLRGVRAIEVLERVGTPEARELLQAWADQGRDPRLAAETRSVLGRVGAAKK
ncbi:MAG: PQQ-binding-like beta-propeller repeat protein, partial [Zavarzinella sp.]|nr:PQQ-binding-like beta-propeller repeat protein [Zavarzinella sp.]